MRVIEKIWGKEVDSEGRCVHYHQDNDVVALRCSQCKKYFSCYKCHDEIENHKFMATKKEEDPVICGHCELKLNFNSYSLGKCPNCQIVFNANCHRHWNIYFK